jgi:hypothetical protein
MRKFERIKAAKNRTIQELHDYSIFLNSPIANVFINSSYRYITAADQVDCRQALGQAKALFGQPGDST